jgi:methionyl-tRNA formyltransferase
VLNIHYSLLPKHRGATPLEGALLAGDTVTGVTIQKMVKALDAGAVLAQTQTPIDLHETARELRPRLITLGAELLVETLPRYLADELTPQAQDPSLSTHSGKFKKEDGLLNLDESAEINWRKYRAYADTIGTYFMHDGKRVKITQAAYKNGLFIVERIIPEGKPERPMW